MVDVTDLKKFPVPSGKFPVVKRNSEDFDQLINGPDAFIQNRAGNDLRTWQGIMNDLLTVNFTGDWVTATNYSVNDAWQSTVDGVVYVVISDYTSGASEAADIALDPAVVAVYQTRASDAVEYDTLADAVATVASDIPVNAFCRAIEYSAGSGGGSTYRLIDAGSPGSRPADDSFSVHHVAGGGGGLYLSIVPDDFNFNLAQAGGSNNGNATSALQAIVDYYIANGRTESNFRKSAATVTLPGLFFTFDDLDLGGVAGTMGLTIQGAGAWGTVMDINPGQTITGFASSNQTFNDITFKSNQIDDDTECFTVSTSSGGSLRSWRFNRCDWLNFYRSFNVTGSSVCSEFYFNQCRWLQCYNLVYNDNVQAVNWNFNQCDWETDGVSTSKPFSGIAPFHLKKGMSVSWNSGSFLIKGALVLFELDTASAFSRASHFISFEKCRMEYRSVDSALLRREGAYVKGSNNPTVFVRDGSLDLGGGVGTNPRLFEAWEGCGFYFTNFNVEGGFVEIDLGAISNNQWPDVKIDKCHNLKQDVVRTSAPFQYASPSLEYNPVTAGVINSTVLPAITESRPYHNGTNPLCPSFSEKSINFTGSTGTMIGDAEQQTLPELNELALIRSIELRKMRNSIADITLSLEDNGSAAVTLSRSGATVTVTQVAHGYFDGDMVRVEDAAAPEYNGLFSIIRTGSDTYTYTVAGTPATPDAGNARKSHGSLTVNGSDRYGILGIAAQTEVSAQRTLRVISSYSSGSEVVKGVVTVNYN